MFSLAFFGRPRERNLADQWRMENTDEYSAQMKSLKTAVFWILFLVWSDIGRTGTQGYYNFLV